MKTGSIAHACLACIGPGFEPQHYKGRKREKEREREEGKKRKDY
jgi:hypothetical protein